MICENCSGLGYLHNGYREPNAQDGEPVMDVLIANWIKCPKCDYGIRVMAVDIGARVCCSAIQNNLK